MFIRKFSIVELSLIYGRAELFFIGARPGNRTLSPALEKPFASRYNSHAYGGSTWIRTKKARGNGFTVHRYCPRYHCALMVGMVGLEPTHFLR